jgi:hypothetical protein
LPEEEEEEKLLDAFYISNAEQNQENNDATNFATADFYPQ